MNKKSTLLMLLLLMILLFSGCGEKVVSLQSVIDGENSFPQEFSGTERKTLQDAWGDTVLSDASYDLWEKDGKYVQAFYENGAVTSLNRSCTLRLKVLEINGESALTEPEEGQWERESGDRIYVPLTALHLGVSTPLSVGDVIEIEYNGLLMETYPAQVGKPYSIRIVSE